MSRAVLPTIFQQDKTKEGISLELRWDPKGPLDLPGFESMALFIAFVPPYYSRPKGSASLIGVCL